MIEYAPIIIGFLTGTTLVAGITAQRIRLQRDQRGRHVKRLIIQAEEDAKTINILSLRVDSVKATNESLRRENARMKDQIEATAPLRAKNGKFVRKAKPGAIACG